MCKSENGEAQENNIREVADSQQTKLRCQISVLFLRIQEFCCIRRSYYKRSDLQQDLYSVQETCRSIIVESMCANENGGAQYNNIQELLADIHQTILRCQIPLRFLRIRQFYCRQDEATTNDQTCSRVCQYMKPVNRSSSSRCAKMNVKELSKVCVNQQNSHEDMHQHQFFVQFLQSPQLVRRNSSTHQCRVHPC